MTDIFIAMGFWAMVLVPWMLAMNRQAPHGPEDARS